MLHPTFFPVLSFLVTLFPFGATSRPASPASPAFQEALEPPEVGQVACPLGTVYWYDLGTAKVEPNLADMRGSVVLVHTWGYYCGPCMKAGVPNVAAAMEANAERGLRAVSITVPVGDDKPDDYFVKVGRDMGLKHALGTANGFGDMSPYVNLNAAKALTWCFVIGRAGDVRWIGNPSREEEDFLEAIRLALAQAPIPPLPENLSEKLSKAVQAFTGGDLARARTEADKLASKLAGKSDEESRLAGEQASALRDAIDAHRVALEASLEASLTAGDAETFVRDRGTYALRFAKGGAAKVLKPLDKRVKEDPSLAAAVKAWTLWSALQVERPVLFGVRDDEASKRYLKKLQRFLKKADEGQPGWKQARAMLEAYANAH